MRRKPATGDEEDAQQDCRRAQAIEQGVEGRQEGQPAGELHRGLSGIDQPQEKYNGGSADGANGQYRALNTVHLKSVRAH